MKKLLLALLLTTSLTAHAEYWAVLADTPTDRLIVDYDSLDLREYTNNGKKSWIMQANMRFVEQKIFMATAIDARECVMRDSGTLAIAASTGETLTKFWSSQGNLVYDLQGAFLCQTVKKLLEKSKAKRTEV